MTNSKDKSPKRGGSARSGARRGSVYEQIAEARAKRRDVLSQRGERSADPTAAGTVAALRGKDAPKPVSRKALANPDPDDVPPPVRTVRPKPEPARHQPERSLEDVVMAAETTGDQTRRGNGPIWIASLTIAALAVGSVAWFSRPATVPLDEIAPVVSLDDEAPSVFADGTLSLKSPEASDALQLELASSAWSGLRVVAPDAPSSPGLDSAARAPEAAPEALALDTTPAPQPRPEDLAGPGTDAAIEPETETVVDLSPDDEPLAEVATSQDTTSSVEAEQPVEMRDIRVVLNAPRTVPDASLAAVIEALEQSGANADPRRVNLTISNSNVRYFHSEDAEAAAIIANGIGARLRDFTDFEPAPPEGLVEIWMAGREISAPTQTARGPLDQLAQDLRQLERDLRRALGGN